jgi:hypothetical protein
MILESLNNIVQYQYEGSSSAHCLQIALTMLTNACIGNVNIVYAIIRRKEIFEALNNLTLPAAIRGAVDVAERKAQGKALPDRLRLVKGSVGKSPEPSPRSSSDSLHLSKDSTHSRRAEDERTEHSVDEATPTDLISTAKVQRTVDASGEELEYTSTAQEQTTTESKSAEGQAPASEAVVAAEHTQPQTKLAMRFTPNQVSS